MGLMLPVEAPPETDVTSIMATARRLIAGVAGALVIVACGTDGTAPPTETEWLGFRNPVAYPSGGTALTTLVAADVTGDERLDLLTAASGEAARVLPGVGGGVFGSATVHVAGNDPRGAHVGDVNGDGTPDLVVIGHFDNAFFVRLGETNGRFGAATTYALRNHGRRVAIADLNGDAYDDVVAVHDGSGQPVYVTVFVGSASGALQRVWEAATNYTTSRDVAVGEFDGDGRADIAVGVGDQRTGLVIFRGIGDGEFGPPAALAPLPPPTPGAADGTQGVAAADVNGDGLDDLVVAHSMGVDGVVVRLSTGTGFGAPTVIDPAPSLDVAVADVDGDDHADVILSDLDDGTVSVLLGAGNGTFDVRRRFAVGAAPVSIAVGDFDGDDRADVAVTDIGDHRVRILLNRGP